MKYWTEEIKERLKKIEKLCDNGCDIHTYNMGDGVCNCKERRQEIIKLSIEIAAISQKIYKFEEEV